jgi:hypothetical protein
MSASGHAALVMARDYAGHARLARGVAGVRARQAGCAGGRQPVH